MIQRRVSVALEIRILLKALLGDMTSDQPNATQHSPRAHYAKSEA